MMLNFSAFWNGMLLKSFFSFFLKRFIIEMQSSNFIE
jgi:hypothetical protein